MRAMILAAGAGTRLRPLTFSRAKPMVPVVNEPNIGHVLGLLQKAGIKEAAVNLHLYPEQIKRYIGQGKKWNLKIRYSHEAKLRGTAGSLAPLKNFFKGEPFFVLSGDGVTDMDLNEILASHKSKNAIATMIVAKTDARCEYGLVKMDGDQRIDAILEKPTWGDFYSPYVNTGFYVFDPAVLDLIPATGEFDFARDLWPKLIAQKKPVYAYELQSYWCDVGNLKEYKKCHRDILEGRAKIAIQGQEIKPGVWVGKNTSIAKGVTLEAPIVIGDDVNIQKNARIYSFTVIGNKCLIGEKAQITESILWDSVRIAPGVKASGCVLADKTVLKESVAFYEGAVINIK